MCSLSNDAVSQAVAGQDVGPRAHMQLGFYPLEVVRPAPLAL